MISEENRHSALGGLPVVRGSEEDVAGRMRQALDETPGGAVLAERRGMAWLLLPFAAFDAWQAGLALLFAYAAASFFWAQRQVHSAAARGED